MSPPGAQTASCEPRIFHLTQLCRALIRFDADHPSPALVDPSPRILPHRPFVHPYVLHRGGDRVIRPRKLRRPAFRLTSVGEGVS